MAKVSEMRFILLQFLRVDFTVARRRSCVHSVDYEFIFAVRLRCRGVVHRRHEVRSAKVSVSCIARL